MSGKKRKPVRRKQSSRAQNERTATRTRKRRRKGMTPAKTVLLFLVVIGLVFAAAAILGDPNRGGRVWSEEHQHWHFAR